VYSALGEIDAEIANLKLAAMGIEIDVLTDEQLKVFEFVGRRNIIRFTMDD